MTHAEAEMTETICSLRAQLRSVASMLDGVLSDGFPKKGRGQDNAESFEQWFEDRHLAVKRAEELLAETEKYTGVVVG